MLDEKLLPHSLLPIQDPVLIFSIVLMLMLIVPVVFRRFRIPPLIGLILAGLAVGPFGFNVLRRDSSMVLFGTVGLLYIMFQAALEIDLDELRSNIVRTIAFGLLTFLLPMGLGFVAGYYVLGYSVPASLLIASMFSSHTLVAYPAVTQARLSQERSVQLAVGATLVTDVLALLVLAGVIGTVQEQSGATFWLRLSLSTAAFVAIVIVLFPWITRRFFSRTEDGVSRYIFVLALVFLGGALAQIAGLEAIIGAFLAGLALSQFIPDTSSLMHRIRFVGEAIFIPFFLLSVGMLVDLRTLASSWMGIETSLIILAGALIPRAMGAWIAGTLLHYSRAERQMLHGLTTSRAAATLAIVLVGFNTIVGETPNGDPIRLLPEEILGGAIVLILVSCTLSSVTVERAIRALRQPGGTAR